VAGGTHTCGTTATGTTYCWGSNGSGQIGDGTTTSCATPVAVAGGLALRSLSAGYGRTCGLDGTGAAYCWGANAYGQLGDGSTTSRATPTPVAGGITFASLSAGEYHACGVSGGGAAFCWGYNCCGQLGLSTPIGTTTSTPMLVDGGLTFQQIDTRAFDVTCGLTTAGAAYCWGTSGYGDLVGTGPLGYYMNSPLAVVGGLTFRSLAAGGAYTCGLTNSGAAYCWGGYGTEFAMGRTRPQVYVTSPVAVNAP
jgi:alpha-tubulin suppressor-like RCC1 family protein